MKAKKKNRIIDEAISFIHIISEDTVSEKEGNNIIKKLWRIKFCNLHDVVGQSEQLNFVPKKGDKVIAWADTYCEVVDVQPDYVICIDSKHFSFMVDSDKLRPQKI